MILPKENEVNDNDFIIAILRTVTVGIVALISIAGGCTYGETRLVADLVLKGTPPSEARCIVGQSEDRVCLVIAAKK